MHPSWQHRIPLSCSSRWLASPGSLTARLQANGRFRVQTLFTGWGDASWDERELLAERRARRVYVREVCLLVDDVPCVIARTVSSVKSMHHAWRAIRGLGLRPLGAALWCDPLVRRGPMGYAGLQSHHLLFQRLARRYPELPPRLAARRSCFYRRGQALLVMEAFLPAVDKLKADIAQGSRLRRRAAVPR